MKSPDTQQVFHLLFKTMALLVYLFSGIFTSNYIFVAVLTILLLAFDFWTVKKRSHSATASLARNTVHSQGHPAIGHAIAPLTPARRPGPSLR